MQEIFDNVKIVHVADNPWSSPDGKVTIWTIKYEYNGERDTVNTMSKVLATEGWTGDIEIYTNDKGKEYARQAPKEQLASSHGGDTYGEGMAWGNALTNATNLVIQFGPKDMKLSVAGGLVLKTAHLLVEGREQQAPAEKSGLDKAREVAEKIKQTNAEREMSIVEEYPEFNPDEIPF